MAAGAALVLTALTGILGGGEVGTAGSVPPPAPSVTASDAPVADARVAEAPVAAAESRAAGADATPLRPAVTPVTLPTPERLRIGALEVAAPVVPVGLLPQGAMELPEDVREVGWFAPGPVPGQAGSAVLAGHVDSRTQGRGALFDLRELGPGDTVEVDADDGTTTTWRVTGRTAYTKDELPIEALFRRDGPVRLVLITCGGAFDASTGHYEDNVVVIAEPA